MVCGGVGGRVPVLITWDTFLQIGLVLSTKAFSATALAQSRSSANSCYYIAQQGKSGTCAPPGHQRMRGVSVKGIGRVLGAQGGGRDEENVAGPRSGRKKGMEQGALPPLTGTQLTPIQDRISYRTYVCPTSSADKEPVKNEQIKYVSFFKTLLPCSQLSSSSF